MASDCLPRVSYATVLKLLRAGATVLTTTRFPADAALRYSREADFGTWAERLRVVSPLKLSDPCHGARSQHANAHHSVRSQHAYAHHGARSQHAYAHLGARSPQVGPLELSDILLVERFCAAMVLSYPRLHCLVNNAAQTLTRPAGWQVRMAELEDRAHRLLPPAAAALLRAPTCLETCSGVHRMLTGECSLSSAPELCSHPTAALPHTLPPPPLTLPPTALATTTTSHDGAHDGARGTGSATASAHDGARGTGSATASAHDDASALLGASAPLVSTAGLGEVALADSSMQSALIDFPAGVLDESRQPLDLSGINSWSRRLGEVMTSDDL